MIAQIVKGDSIRCIGETTCTTLGKTYKIISNRTDCDGQFRYYFIADDGEKDYWWEDKDGCDFTALHFVHIKANRILANFKKYVRSGHG